MSTMTRSESAKNEDLVYPALTDEQRAEYFRFFNSLLAWLDINPDARCSFGWAAAGSFVVGMGVGERTTLLALAREISLSDLHESLDAAKLKLASGKSKRGPVALPPSPPSANDDWDW